jgi:hypothetical protein
VAGEPVRDVAAEIDADGHPQTGLDLRAARGDIASSESDELLLAVPAQGSHYTSSDFNRAVAAAQLAVWLPEAPALVLDLSGAGCFAAGQAAELGHQVIQVLQPGERPAVGASGVVGDLTDLGWLQPHSLDIVVAEAGVLSTSLATEVTVAQLARVLRPGGRAWICAESLLSGCATLAEAGRWAELSDVPAADVVLVPGQDGRLTRCFGPEELRSLLLDAGFAVDWVRPRTVLPVAPVEATLRADPSRLPALVRTEVALAAQRQEESIGAQLLASAHLPMAD